MYCDPFCERLIGLVIPLNLIGEVYLKLGSLCFIVVNLYLLSLLTPWDNYSIQRHSSLTPIYMYSHRMMFLKTHTHSLRSTVLWHESLWTKPLDNDAIIWWYSTVRLIDFSVKVKDLEMKEDLQVFVFVKTNPILNFI